MSDYCSEGSAGPLLQLPDSPKEAFLERSLCQGFEQWSRSMLQEASPTNDVVTAKPVAFSPSARIEDGLWQILECLSWSNGG